MQQTALNLIAIGVFAITLSSLLGPLFNISPAIPALATFGILGIATLDTFGWQGKGVTLLLDSLAGASTEYRARIIRHEAGHFLVAYLLDMSITGYALSAWEAFKQGQPGQGGVTFAEPELTAPLSPLLIQRYCTVWMAGIAAETLVYGTAEGGAEDRQKLQVLVSLRGTKQSQGIPSTLGRPASDCLQQERFCTLQAKTLIQEHWAAYEALVTAMTQRSPVADCYQAIEQHRS